MYSCNDKLNENTLHLAIIGGGHSCCAIASAEGVVGTSMHAGRTKKVVLLGTQGSASSSAEDEAILLTISRRPRSSLPMVTLSRHRKHRSPTSSEATAVQTQDILLLIGGFKFWSGYACPESSSNLLCSSWHSKSTS